MDLRESDSEPMLCLFNIAKFIDCLVGDTSLRLIYIH